ncbi:MAG TPA: DUF2243 domain-containing protein [Tianweitania sediminis]|nr:DUF2243 domain-containing protein [Tianweitania sediminis]
MAARAQLSRRAWWAALLIGFSLGGFFDGILLHQILQWHHLLSLVDGIGDLSSQVLFDGLFHLLMYVIGAVGLVLLLWARRELGGSTRLLVAATLIGFGAWHTLDAVLSHWLLGIHRIKLDSANPLAWDLAWLVVFGLLPAGIGVLLTGRSDGTGGANGGRAAAALVVLVAIGALWAAQAPADSRSALVVFRPGMDQAQMMRAVVASGGALLWEKRGIWAVRWDDEPPSGQLYRDGAWLVSNSFLPAGCLSWAQL